MSEKKIKAVVIHVDDDLNAIGSTVEYLTEEEINSRMKLHEWLDEIEDLELWEED